MGDQGALGDVQGAANEAVDSVQSLANHAIGLGAEAAGDALSIVTGLIRALADTADKLGAAVKGG